MNDLTEENEDRRASRRELAQIVRQAIGTPVAGTDFLDAANDILDSDWLRVQRAKAWREGLIWRRPNKNQSAYLNENPYLDENENPYLGGEINMSNIQPPKGGAGLSHSREEIQNIKALSLNKAVEVVINTDWGNFDEDSVQFVVNAAREFEKFLKE